MKNLAADIKISHKDRTSGFNGIKRETREILGAADDYMQRVRAELKEMARELKEFLAKSEAARKKDFEAIMRETSADIEAVKRSVGELRKSTRGLIVDYRAERKEAAGYWASLGRGKAFSTAEEAPAPKAEKKEKKEKKEEK